MAKRKPLVMRTPLLAILVAVASLTACLGGICTRESVVVMTTPEEQQYWVASVGASKDTSDTLDNSASIAAEPGQGAAAYY